MAHEIRLYGPIGGFFGYTADEILRQIPENAKEVTIRIHSPGGSVGEGLAMYHALRDHPANITTIVDGYAASSASFVMLAGDVVQVHRNSIIYVHNPWTYAEGNASELRKTVAMLDVHAEAILDIYKQRTDMTENDLRDMMDETKFFRGAEAVDNGFADVVLDDAEAEAQIAAMLRFEEIAANYEGDTKVSTQKTRRELNDDNAELSKQLTAKDEAIATMAADHKAALAASKSDADAKTGEVEAKSVELTDKLTTAEAALAAEKKQGDEVREQRDGALAKIEEISGKLDVATKDASDKAEHVTKLVGALKNPATADAVLKEVGVSDLTVTADADAEAIAAEKRAQEEAKNNKPKNIKEEYEAMAQGPERTKFMEDNQKAILACGEEDTDDA